VDKNGRGGLEDAPFSYREGGSGKVFISWRGRPVLVLKGDQARSFLERVAHLDDAGRQLAMARATGNFKRGNER
jgi:hypothetical protein